MTASPPKAIRIAILAMGGEGGGVLANWIVDLAEEAGSVAQLTSVPGVAQRTGATIYYVEIFPKLPESDQTLPVLALMPVPGDVDIVIASELMEAGRAIQRGIVTPDRTLLIASTDRVFAMTEKIPRGDGRVGRANLMEACRTAANRLIAFDMAKKAEEAGSVLSAVMFGALAGSGALPFGREAFLKTIERGGIGVSASKRAFDLGFAAANNPPAEEAAPAAPPKAAAPAPLTVLKTEAAQALAIPSLPAAIGDILDAALARLLDYQGSDYARLFLKRLQPVAALDRAHGDGEYRLLGETARQLALGMAYEDTIRVAELKIRASRFARVEKEVRLQPGQILTVSEFLHPRLQEVAETVPAPIGRFILNNPIARRLVGAFTQSGRIVETTSIRGMLLLASVAWLKPHRPKSLRYAEEQDFLESWLAEIARIAPQDYELAVEIAETRNLVKGYGDTLERGKANYHTLLAELPSLHGKPDAAAHFKVYREAALADESGEKLKALLALRD